jgi:hypothetical protein
MCLAVAVLATVAVPGGPVFGGTAETSLLASQDAVGQLLRESCDLDLEAIRFRNPVARDLQLFNLATGFLLIAAHERRHLAQVRQVREHANFPSS